MRDYSEIDAKNGQVICSSYADGLLVIPKSYGLNSVFILTLNKIGSKTGYPF
jgi:hypothetical protein